MEVLLVLVIVAAVAVFVSVPLRAGGGGHEATATEDPRRAALEARKESKYREIRDAELDRAQGKLSHEDWARLDAQLRAEAVAILRELDELD